MYINYGIIYNVVEAFEVVGQLSVIWSSKKCPSVSVCAQQGPLNSIYLI